MKHEMTNHRSEIFIPSYSIFQGNDLWLWKCSEEVEQPTDITQIDHEGNPRNHRRQSNFSGKIHS